MLADNAATPSLHPQSVKVLAAPRHAQLSLRITESLIALLQQHTAAKNTSSEKSAPSAAPPPLPGPKESGGKLDAANCQLKRHPSLQRVRRVQVCASREESRCTASRFIRQCCPAKGCGGERELECGLLINWRGKEKKKSYSRSNYSVDRDREHSSTLNPDPSLNKSFNSKGLSHSRQQTLQKPQTHTQHRYR